MTEDSYENIAEDYDFKRKKPWNALKVFIKMILEFKYNLKGYILDLGCGNARNIPLIKIATNRIIGIDIALNFLKIAKQSQKSNLLYDIRDKNTLDFINCDFLYLPLRESRVDSIFSIASLHHIRNEINRQRFISEIKDLLKHNGFLIISVWRRYQKNYKWYFIRDFFKRKISKSYKEKQAELGLSEYGDKYIPWTVSKNGKTFNRFYHFFSKNEISKLLSPFKVLLTKKLGGPNKKDNIFILAQKTS